MWQNRHYIYWSIKNAAIATDLNLIGCHNYRQLPELFSLKIALIIVSDNVWCVIFNAVANSLMCKNMFLKISSTLKPLSWRIPWSLIAVPDCFGSISNYGLLGNWFRNQDREKRTKDWKPKKTLILYKLWQVLLDWVFRMGIERFTCPDIHTRV